MSACASPPLTLEPCEFAEAKAFILEHHRHHKPPQGHRFSLKATVDGKTVAVATVGRPVARHNDDGRTLEITRLCSDGTRNACSFLIGAVKRVGRAMGFKRLISYTLESEPGASWRAAGMAQTGTTPGQAWDYAGAEVMYPLLDPTATRNNAHPLGDKRRWEVKL